MMNPSKARIRQFLLLAAVLSSASLAPAAEPAWRFVALSDTHIAHPREIIRFRQFLYTVAREEKPDFVLITGDVCGHAPEYLPQIRDVAAASGLPVHVLPGNHDDNYAGNSEWWKEVFGRMYYSFDHKGVHFVMNWSQAQPAEWVKKDLAAVAAATPVIFCQHYPPAMQGEGDDAVTEAVQAAGNVKLILYGHTHRFAEGKLGEIPMVNLRNCNFSPVPANPGDSYVCEVFEGGTVRVQAKPLKAMKLLSPPDELPAVKALPPGEELSGKLTLRGSATDDKGLKAVQVSIDAGPWEAAKGTDEWAFDVDTAKLLDGHHVFRVRAIDSADQPTLDMPSLLRLVRNAKAAPAGVHRFQQGTEGYTGCTDVTVSKQDDRKSPLGFDVEPIDLENWTWNAGKLELSEFYIRFDLSKAGIPAGAAIERVTLTIYGSRQNGVKDTDTERGRYAVGVLTEPWSDKMTFADRPAKPGWKAATQPEPKPALTGIWPYLGGRQLVWPPQEVKIDLTPIKDVVAKWIKDPAGNHGLVFSPYGLNYNFSAQSTDSPVRTLRPRLEIQVKKP